MNRKEYHKQYREDNREKRRKWNRDWIQNNKERYNASKYIYRDKLKIEIMDYYGGGECKWCGIKDIDVLCIDHIDNDGAEDRLKRGVSGRSSAGTNAYEALKRDGFPEGFQVLCANCNLKKEQELKRALRLENSFYAQRYEREVLPICQV